MSEDEKVYSLLRLPRTYNTIEIFILLFMNKFLKQNFERLLELGDFK